MIIHSFYLVSEGFILRELIYALQGTEGVLFQKDLKDFSISIKVIHQVVV
jgi:hypothetical protein